MTRERYQSLHRTARLGNLGTLTFMAGEHYDWFLSEVYDIRFPHIGDNRHCVPSTFDSLRVSTARRLAVKRQLDYQSHIRFCSSCHSYHHDRHDCAYHYAA